ncbi:MAG: enamine deaminase RidA (YjgF/YER057c/UK114 family) [Myxococcota bacterium]|jgi:enamine deaminase RidA (YjgF/YER057c/UK114 family)
MSRVRSASPYEARYGFCRALRRGDRFVAGTAPINPDGTSCLPDAASQTRRCITIMLDAVRALGGSAEDVVRTRMFITDPKDSDDIGRAHGEAFGAHPPVATMVVVAALLDERWRVEMELEAQLT